MGEVVELRRGRVMSKGYLIDNAGDYPVYSSQTANNGMIGKIRTYDFDGEYVNWTTDGANAGTVFYRTGKFSITNVSGIMKVNDASLLSSKFIFYWLSIEAKKHVYSGMGNPKLMSNQVAKIPVLSLRLLNKLVSSPSSTSSTPSPAPSPKACRARSSCARSSTSITAICC